MIILYILASMYQQNEGVSKGELFSEGHQMICFCTVDPQQVKTEHRMYTVGNAAAWAQRPIHVSRDLATALE